MSSQLFEAQEPTTIVEAFVVQRCLLASCLQRWKVIGSHGDGGGEVAVNIAINQQFITVVVFAVLFVVVMLLILFCCLLLLL